MASRRSLFAGSAIMALDAPAALAQSADIRHLAVSPHPDAELIALCRRYCVLVDQIREAWHAMPDHYDYRQEKVYDAEHLTPLEEEQEELLKRMKLIRARTLQGLLARIEMTVKDYPDLIEGAGGDEGMIAGILLDGLALRTAGADSA